MDRLYRRWVDPYLALLLLVTLVALTPLAAPGYFYSAHDGRHTVFYLAMFDAGLRDGAWWPTWAMHHIQGYGYPTFLIQAPIGFYMGAFFVWLGTGYTDAVKLTWAVGFLGSAWGMYRLMVHWLSPVPIAQPTRDKANETRDNQAKTTASAGGNERNARQLAPEMVREPIAASAHQSAACPQEGGLLGAIDPVRGAALVVGLLYALIPYHLAGMYVRAALNDTLLLAWFPWVFLAFDRLLQEETSNRWPRRLAIAAILLAATLLTHTFALVSFAPLVVTFVGFLLLQHLFLITGPLARTRRWRGFLKRSLLAGTAGLLALVLCTAFLLPLFVEGRYLDQQVYVTDTYDFRRHFVQLGQYFSPFWGFGYSDDPVGANDGMGFQVGLIVLAISMAGIAIPWPHARRRWLAGYLAVATIALLLFMSPLAQPLWETLSPLAVIQFPWRLLALVALVICPLAGFVLYEILQAGGTRSVSATQIGQGQQVGLLLVAALVVLGSRAYIQAMLEPIEPWREDGRAVYAFERDHPDMIAYTTWVQERPFTESVMSADYADADYTELHGYTTDLTRLTIVRGVGTVRSNYSRGASFGGTVQVSTPATVRVNLYYFPGWVVRVDGTVASYHISEQHGLIDVEVPAGEHRIDVRMGTTWVRQLGGGISALALVVVLLLFVWPGQRNLSSV